VPALGDCDDGEIGGIIGRGNWSTWGKPTQVLLCSPQTPCVGQMRTWAAAVGSQQLTAWAMAHPWFCLYSDLPLPLFILIICFYKEKNFLMNCVTFQETDLARQFWF
jgi:hypothetical protein